MIPGITVQVESSMIYFNLTFLILFLILYLFSLKKKNEGILNIDKKKHKLYFLYPLADFLLRKIGLEKVVSKKTKVKDSIKALYFTGKPELQTRLFWCRQISLMLLILVLFNLLSAVAMISEMDSSQIINGRYIRRPGHGEGNTSVDLNLSIRNPEYDNTSEEEVSQLSDLTIEVGEQRYTEEELSILFEKSVAYLQKAVLGSNKSADAIYDNLNFIKTIPGTGIKVDWIPENHRLIQMDGTIKQENIGSEGVTTLVTVILTYGDSNQRYTKEHSMSFRIMPRIYSDEELLLQKLKEEIAAAQERTREDKYLELPDSLGKYRLVWDDDKKGNGLALLFLGVVLAAVWTFGDKELDKQMKVRKKQMLMDYPEVINKFTLLVNAGMTIKQAWMKLAEDYSIMKAKNGKQIRYAYEEMLLTVQELKFGIPEERAYEQFGKRTGLPSYMKFSSLINQNLKKGTKGFTEQLMYEASEAFEERKEAARRLGEEVGTKLLIPMLVMLIIVFLIIMIPAFMSFHI